MSDSQPPALLPLYIPPPLCYHHCMSQSPSTIIEVAVAIHLDKTFHYRVPPQLVSTALPGHRVFVPFGHRKLTGYILGRIEEADDKKLKDIIDVLDPDPLWTDRELEFFRWIAAYYLHPLGEVLKSALPVGINLKSRKKGVDEKEQITGGKKVKTERFYRPAITTETGRTGQQGRRYTGSNPWGGRHPGSRPETAVWSLFSPTEAT